MFLISLAFICHAAWSISASIFSPIEPIPFLEKLMDIFPMFAVSLIVLFSVEITLRKWKIIFHVSLIHALVITALETLSKANMEDIGYMFRLIRPTHVALALITYFSIYTLVSSVAFIKSSSEVKDRILKRRLFGMGLACIIGLFGWVQILIILEFYPKTLIFAYAAALIAALVAGMLSHFSFAYKMNIAIDKFAKFLRARKLDPLSSESRIMALLSSYTSEAGEYPFYDPSLPSKCKLDPLSRRHWDCEGRVFINGFTCPYLIDYLEEKSNKNLKCNDKNVSSK